MAWFKANPANLTRLLYVFLELAEEIRGTKMFRYGAVGIRNWKVLAEINNNLQTR